MQLFCDQANSPDPCKLPQDDILGVTVLFLSCSYRDKVRCFHLLISCTQILQALDVQEFIRVGYYVNNDYQDQNLRENPPDKPLIEKCET